MTEAEIREVIADALVYASVPGFTRSETQAAFIAGTTDVAFAELEVDSLAAMELCIAIEANLDVSVVPAELASIETLGGWPNEYGSCWVLEVYDRLLGKCRTINAVNNIHIAFGNTITPQEVIDLHEALFVSGTHPMPKLAPDAVISAGELHSAVEEWLHELRNDLRHAEKDAAEPFLRRDIRKSVTLYTNGEAAAGKTLVLGLAGANNRLMMPISTLLQDFPAATTDILMVRDPTRSAYRAELEDIANSIEELGPALAELVDFGEYGRRVGLGVSAGGLPILMIALQMQFDAVLSCGPASPFHAKWERPGKPAPADTLRAYADRPTQRVLAFGAQSEADRASARDIASCIDVELVEVAIEATEVKHNVLHPLHRRHLLRAFLSRHLGIDA